MTSSATRRSRRATITRTAVAASVPLMAIAALTATGQTAAVLTPEGAKQVDAGSRRAGSWAPAATTLGGLSTLATSNAKGFQLLTKGGGRQFVAGVDLGVTTPGHQPGEVAIDATDYRRWFTEMGAMGIRAVRIYTIHRPAFYTELLRYNQAHPRDPIYLVQGVYIPDESYLDGGTLYDKNVDEGFSDEIADAVRAVHGDLTRGRLPGRASGTWTADVSPWLMSWIIGVEWDPNATKRTDARNASAPAVNGYYFRSTANATPTERWIAKHMNALAQLQASRGQSEPIAFVNWPTTDPLHHPNEPMPEEDMVSVDANHVLPTAAWPGGTFASYHAYPYYPDFLRYEPDLQKPQTTGAAKGTVDAYAAYLSNLKKYHTSMPVMITETGVPSSIGSAHNGPLDRDQGGHTEQEATQIDAQLLNLVKSQGLAGAFLFSWSDEWFKFTWNTILHQLPANRRQLWHDPLTNEQYYGLVATDPKLLTGAHVEQLPENNKISKVVFDADESYLYLDVTYRDGEPREPLVISSDTVPGGTGSVSDGGSDYRIQVDPRAGSGQALVRAALDPAQRDTWETLPQAGEPWHLYRLITNRSYPGVTGSTMEYQDTGALVRGSWDPADPDYDSLSTWRVTGNTVRLRIPWALIGISDPSSRTALGAGDPPATYVLDKGITLSLSVGGAVPYRTSYSWPTWDAVSATGYTERMKTGVQVVANAFTSLNR